MGKMGFINKSEGGIGSRKKMYLLEEGNLNLAGNSKLWE